MHFLSQRYSWRGEGARMERQVSAPTFTAHTEEAGEGGMKAEEPARCASNSEKMH